MIYLSNSKKIENIMFNINIEHGMSEGSINYLENRPLQISWNRLFYLSFTHILAIIGFINLISCSYKTIIFALILWPISGLGITAGSHRLWSHRSYEASYLYRLLLMLFQSMACQGTIKKWAIEHRVHHKYSETCADPHNAKRGFWYAQIGWMILTSEPETLEAMKKIDCSDLEKDSVVRLQEKLGGNLFCLLCCFILPASICYFGWSESFFNGICIAGALRYILVLHFTGLVNSAAHLWGEKPYDPNSNPSENSFVSFLAIGEGWHNWHHKYPFDYAASEYGILARWNPTKLFIDLFHYLGFVYNRKRALNLWHKSNIYINLIN